MTTTQLAARKREISKETIREFHRAGYENVRPRVNVLTAKKWIAKGFIPTKGTKAVRVNDIPLFHKTQVTEIS